MKLYKEYPATHSMSTAWYIVDDEGNVGMMDYNDNGPVPWGVEQTCCEELLFGHWDDNQKLLKVNLTNEQVLDALKEPHSPSEETLWADCAVRIDLNKTARFLELCQNKELSGIEKQCLSNDLGIYLFDALLCSSGKHGEEVPAFGALKIMLDENIILEVYRVQNLWMNDYYEEDELVYEKEFDNSPYYVFYQPYGTDDLPKKMHEPEHPVKVNQIPEEFRHRLHHIPGNFKSLDTFQIAQHYPCDANDSWCYLKNRMPLHTFPCFQTVLKKMIGAFGAI